VSFVLALLHVPSIAPHMKAYAFVAMAGVTLGACTESTRSGQAAPPRNPTCDFDIFTAVPEGYTEVGTVDVTPGPYGISTFRNLNSFKHHIRANVCELGGDAAIAWANGRGVYIKATVIRRLPRSSNSPGPSVPPSSNPPPPPSESNSSVARKPFPKTALGFEFGTSPEASQSLCTSQGHEWRAEEEEHECMGAGVDVGAPIRTTLSYCDDHLCDLRAYITLSADSVGQRQFIKLRRALVLQYGRPTKEKSTLPSDCRTQMMACIAEGKGQWEAQWTWPDGSNIRARTGTDGESPVVGIRYHLNVSPDAPDEPPDDVDTFDVSGF